MATPVPIDPVSQKMRVFLSYSRRDLPAAEKLRRELMDADFEAYLDQHDISKGEPWRERLAGLIQNADVMLFLISPDSISSEVCDWEINEAERLGKRLIPVVIRDTPNRTVPARLGRLNFVFLDQPVRYPSEFSGLLEALKADSHWVREHTRLGELAARWAKASRPARLLIRGKDIAAAESWRSSRTPTAPEISALHAEYIDSSRRNATHQQRLWFAGSLGALILTVGLAALAWGQRNEAVEARLIAEAREARLRAEAGAQSAISALTTTDTPLGSIRAIQALDAYRASGASDTPALLKRALMTSARKGREVARIKVPGQPNSIRTGDAFSQVKVILRTDRLVKVDPDSTDPVETLYSHPAYDPLGSDSDVNVFTPPGQKIIVVEAPTLSEYKFIDWHGKAAELQPGDLATLSRYVLGQAGEVIGQTLAGKWVRRTPDGNWLDLEAPEIREGELYLGDNGRSLVMADDASITILRRQGNRLVPVVTAAIQQDTFAANFIVVAEEDSTVLIHGSDGISKGAFFVDTETGMVQALLGYGARHGEISEMALSRDGSAVALLFEEGLSSGSRTNLEAWTRSGFRILPPTAVPSGSGLAFSHDGQSVWVGDYIGSEIRQYQLDYPQHYLGLDTQTAIWDSALCPDSDTLVYLYGEDLWKIDLSRDRPQPERLASGFDHNATVGCLRNQRALVATLGLNYLISNNPEKSRTRLQSEEELVAFGSTGQSDLLLGRQSGRLYMLTGMELAGPGRQLASASIEKIVLDRNKHQAIILGHSFVSAFDLSGSTPHQTFELGAGALDQRSPQASASNQDGSRWLTGSTGEPWKIFDPAGRIIGERADPHFPMTTSIVNFVFHSLFVTSGMNSRISVMSEELETFIEDLYAFDSVAGMIDLYALDADRFVATDLQGVVIVASLSQSAAVQEICKNLRSFARTASDFAGLAEALEGCKRQTKETLDAPPPK